MNTRATGPPCTPIARRSRPTRLAVFAAAVSLSLASCSQYIDPNVPEPIRPHVEPEHGGDYLIYRPSHYDRRYTWPLIVVCHTSFPDSPNRRIRNWTELAESHGFIVVAPKLTSPRRILPRKAQRQLTRLRDDEQRILATIRHIRAGHNISEDRIFIHGFSGGGFAALYTGLRHPGLFRAVALTQPRFHEGGIAAASQAIDPHQPVLVEYSLSDVITGKHARRCIDWLRTHGARLTEDSSGLDHGADMNRPAAFFEEVARRVPWIHIRALPGPRPQARPMEVQFKLRTSHRPTRYLWDFGDAKRAGSAEPIHTYAAPGTYRVSVTVEDARGAKHHRLADLKVPERILTRVRPTTTPTP